MRSEERSGRRSNLAVAGDSGQRISGNPDLGSRGFNPKGIASLSPRVAKDELPWVNRPANVLNPEGVEAFALVGHE
jgi:hypothetical protein